jgi:hypothetical protein
MVKAGPWPSNMSGRVYWPGPGLASCRGVCVSTTGVWQDARHEQAAYVVALYSSLVVQLNIIVTWLVNA